MFSFIFFIIIWYYSLFILEIIFVISISSAINTAKDAVACQNMNILFITEGKMEFSLLNKQKKYHFLVRTQWVLWFMMLEKWWIAHINWICHHLLCAICIHLRIFIFRQKTLKFVVVEEINIINHLCASTLPCNTLIDRTYNKRQWENSLPI